jgi:hypothetical protein
MDVCSIFGKYRKEDRGERMKLADLPKKYRPDWGVQGKGPERECTVENAVIASVSLSVENHRCLTGWLYCDWEGSGCGFGGYKLGDAEGGGPNLTNSGNYAAEWIVRCLEVVGVGRWEHLAGKPVRVLCEGLGGGIVAVGNYLKDEWFCPRAEFEKAG